MTSLAITILELENSQSPASMSAQPRIEKLADGDRQIEWQLKAQFGDEPQALVRLVNQVDAGSASLAEYLEALDYLSKWLNKNGQYLSLENKLEYLSCVEEVRSRSTAGQLEHFVHTLETMLQDFGCERASDP